MSTKRICFVTAAELTVTAFLLHHLRELSSRYHATVVTDTLDPAFLRRRGLPIDAVPVSIPRSIAPARDLAGFSALVRLFRDRRFDAVHSVTPKAGLLAMSSAAIAKVPVRIHTFTGQVWATRRGPVRGVLKAADWVTASAATAVLADSASQRDFLISEQVVTGREVAVLGAGSISGVDLDRFRPDEPARAFVRAELAVARTATVFLFVGRLKRDKGVLDLARAFAMHAARHPASVLLVVGPDEEQMRCKMESLVTRGRAVFLPFTPHPERLMAAADVLCLPSYREGFGSVVVEAAATGIPAIASRIYGITDAVVDRVTGVLHAPGVPREIADAMDTMASNAPLRLQLGAAAMARARNEFSSQRVTSELVMLYDRLLGSARATAEP